MLCDENSAYRLWPFLAIIHTGLSFHSHIEHTDRSQKKGMCRHKICVLDMLVKTKETYCTKIRNGNGQEFFKKLEARIHIRLNALRACIYSNNNNTNDVRLQ